MVTETKIAKVDKRKLVIIDIEQFYDEVEDEVPGNTQHFNVDIRGESYI